MKKQYLYPKVQCSAIDYVFMAGAASPGGIITGNPEGSIGDGSVKAPKKI